jgi:hypothetical protein
MLEGSEVWEASKNTYLISEAVLLLRKSRV